MRELIPDMNLSDKEIEEIRASLYELGDIIWEDWISKRKKNGKIKNASSEL